MLIRIITIKKLCLIDVLVSKINVRRGEGE